VEIFCDLNAVLYSGRGEELPYVGICHRAHCGGLSLVDKSDLAKRAETDKDVWVDAQAILDKAIERFAAALLLRSV
jgi:hypothetical protein